jgi:hypothetical protein
MRFVFPLVTCHIYLGIGAHSTDCMGDRLRQTRSSPDGSGPSLGRITRSFGRSNVDTTLTTFYGVLSVWVVRIGLRMILVDFVDDTSRSETSRHQETPHKNRHSHAGKEERTH